MTFIPSYTQIDSPDPVNPQDLATKNYVDVKPFIQLTSPTAPTSVAGATTQMTGWTATFQRGVGSWGSPTANAFNIGLAGLYRVKLSIYWGLSTAFNTDQAFHALIYRNGAVAARGSLYVVTLTTGAGSCCSVDKTLNCALNDTITFYAQAGVASSSINTLPEGTYAEVAYLQP